MLSSLRSKIIALVLFILIITAAGIMFFTKQDVGKAMLQAEVRSVSNALGLIHTTIKGEYEGLLDYKVSTVQTRKTQLRHLAGTVLALCREYRTLAAEGVLTDKQAQTRLLGLLHTIHSESGSSVAIFNEQNHIVFHPDRNKIGESIANLRNMKGTLITKIIHGHDALYGGTFSVFTWDEGNEKSEKQLGYFIPFTPWGWTIGSVVRVGDISIQEQKKIRELVKVMEATLAKIRIAKTGGVIIFNSTKQLVTNNPQQLGLPENIMARLIGNEGSGGEFITFSQNQSGETREMLARSFFFKPLDWYVTAIVPVNEIQEPANTLVGRQFLVIMAVSLLALILAIAFVHRISGPLNELARFAKELPNQDLTSEASDHTSIDHLISGHTDEVGRLATAFVFMLSELRTNVANLLEVTSAKERIQSELDVAKEIQEGILPKIFPAFPERQEIQLFASLESAKQVGGDLYDFFFIDDSHLCFVIGDVSDKGVPAALFMAITMTLIRSTAEEHSSPAEIMVRINDKLSRENPNSMFVTLFIGVLNTQTGSVVY
ncbi:MAG: cache domain-containing protein, partial [Desulfoplanes sp.]